MSHLYQQSTPQPYVIYDKEDNLDLDKRLEVKGSDNLTVSELIKAATNNKKIPEDLVSDYGAGMLLSASSVEDLIQNFKLDRDSARQLYAVLSLGKRLFSVQSGSLALIRSVEDVFNHCRSMSNLSTEQLRLLLINTRYQLIHEEVIAMGSLESLNILNRDIFHPAVERRINAIILVHNHPTGDPKPSQADFSFTKKVEEAGKILGIELLDHVIIGKDSYISCKNTLKSKD